MTEGIEYDPLGTVDVTFDDETWHLTRPKYRQLKYFSNELERILERIRDRQQELMAEIEEAEATYEDDPTEENQALVDEASEALRVFNRSAMAEHTIGVLQEMFKQLSEDPLPEDPDDWPAWLAADSSIPGKIVAHWRKAPKASGSNGSG